MDDIIRWGFTEVQRTPIAEILYDALYNKLIPVFGKRENGVSCIASILQPERVLLADFNGDVVGIAGLQFRGSGYLDSSFLTLKKHLGRGIFRAMFNGWLLETKVQMDELYLDTIAVAENNRGQGVGTELLKYVIKWAIGTSWSG